MHARYLKIGLVLIGAVLAFFFYRYRQPRFVAGEKVPDFTAVLADGKTVRFSDLRGKYVLLQFWGSWCGPCRAENPHLVDLYQKYHPQGFEIFSVGIEQNRRAWQVAIEKDGLVWPYHTVELGSFGGELPRLFNIRSIPTTFLVNPDGVIMGVRLNSDRMDEMLQAALSSR
ncbi:MAG: TlpA family protein disulfide reductase [Lewinellaceae bacterium]|nr:TlpA family protein disulfide reductase [Lewinellaceae bacterium]